MQAWHLAPILFLAHAAAMVVDEAWFHRRRGLPRWERWGHPADTLTVLLCYVLALVLAPGRDGAALYVAAAALSTLFVTKDEWVHAGNCTGGEMWLHAFLFAMHPVLLALAGLWRFRSPAPGAEAGHAFFGAFLAGQAAVTGIFLLWQILYWNGPWAPPLPATR
jgi:hypothetical protein